MNSLSGWCKSTQLLQLINLHSILDPVSIQRSFNGYTDSYHTHKTIMRLNESSFLTKWNKLTCFQSSPWSWIYTTEFLKYWAMFTQIRSWGWWILMEESWKLVTTKIIKSFLTLKSRQEGCKFANKSFKFTFSSMKCLYFHSNLTKVCSKGSNWQ